MGDSDNYDDNDDHNSDILRTQIIMILTDLSKLKKHFSRS